MKFIHKDPAGARGLCGVVLRHVIVVDDGAHKPDVDMCGATADYHVWWTERDELGREVTSLICRGHLEQRPVSEIVLVHGYRVDGSACDVPGAVFDPDRNLCVPTPGYEDDALAELMVVATEARR